MVQFLREGRKIDFTWRRIRIDALGPLLVEKE